MNRGTTVAIADDTDKLLRKARTGNQSARDDLLDRHRDRLKRMVAVHLDERLDPRTDPSDVVQETMLVANGRLEQYLRDEPIPFYPWLRSIAWDQVQIHHRKHLTAQKRSVNREEPFDFHIPERSSFQLARLLVDQQQSPPSELMRKEERERVKLALDRLAPSERQVLVLRFLEQLSVDEAASVLQVRLDEAEQFLKKGHGINVLLATRFPDQPEFRHGLASSTYNLARQQAALGRADEAAQSYRAALTLLDDVIEQRSDDIDYRLLQARAT